MTAFGYARDDPKEMSTAKTPPKERHSALAAYRKVLQWIHSNGLSVGDKLDHHAQLVKKLNICNSTLDVAMKWLIEDGVVCRKQRAGTTLLALYPEKPNRSIWRVGIVLPNFESSYFFPLLAQYLHSHLERYGASDRTYMLSISAMPGSEVDARRPEDFSGLREDIDLGGLHAIVTATRLQTRELPVCGAAPSGLPAFGATIDHQRYFIEACEELHRRGSKNPWVIASDSGLIQTRFADAMAEIKSRMPWKIGHPQLVHVPAGVLTGRALCNQILELASKKRPDALVFQDDLSAQGFASRLAYQSAYRPALAVQTSLQIPLGFPVPVIRFELDVNIIAATAVRLLIEKLLKTGTEDKIVWIPSTLNRNPQDEILTGHLPAICI